MKWAVGLANMVFWPVVQIGLSWAFLRMPLRWFAGSRTGRLSDREMWFYRRVVLVRRWKSLLPDGAPWLGGFSKKRLAGRNSAYLREFAAEARRAECAHWAMIACTPICCLWNPLWAFLVMTFYALAANLPCIFAQRYNRMVISRLILRGI